MPVMKAERLVAQAGAVAKTRVYRMPPAASASTFGVAVTLPEGMEHCLAQRSGMSLIEDRRSVSLHRRSNPAGSGPTELVRSSRFTQMMPWTLSEPAS